MEVAVVMAGVRAAAAAAGTQEVVHTIGHMVGVEEVPSIQEQTKITKLVPMKATERSLSSILATNSHSCHCEGQKPMAIHCITVNE